MGQLAFKPVAANTKRAKVLLYGDAGTGKTHCALTFPSPAVIDTEGGADWFEGRFQFVSAATKSYTEAQQLIDQVVAGNVKCETIVLDSLTSIHNTLMSAGGNNTKDGALSIREWGVLKKRERDLMDRLYHRTGKHIVCTAWVKDVYAKPGDVVNGRTITANDLIKVGEQLDFDKKANHAFDFVFKMEVADGKYYGVCVKDRSGQFRVGQRIVDLSWKNLAVLFEGSRKGEEVVRGETEYDAAVQDAALFGDAHPKPVASLPAPTFAALKELFEECVSRGALSGSLGDWCVAHVAPDLADRKPKALNDSESREALRLLKTAVDLARLPAEIPFEEMPAARLAEEAARAADERDPRGAQKAMFALCNERGITEHKRKQILIERYAQVSSNDLTVAQMSDLIDFIKAHPLKAATA